MIKIEEAEEQWKNPAKRHDGRYGAIHHYLGALLQDKQDVDVLELGFGGGTNMIVAQSNLKEDERLFCPTQGRIRGGNRHDAKYSGR